MIEIKRNNDRSWSASSKGAMGRVAVCEDADYTKCLKGLRAMLAEQDRDLYAQEQEMTEFSLKRERYIERHGTELREMANELRNYKGD